MIVEYSILQVINKEINNLNSTIDQWTKQTYIEHSIQQQQSVPSS